MYRTQTADAKSSLAEKSVTLRKFELLDISLASDDDDRGPKYVIVDMEVLQKLFASTTCCKCGMATVELRREAVQPSGEVRAHMLKLLFCRAPLFISPKSQKQPRSSPSTREQ